MSNEMVRANGQNVVRAETGGVFGAVEELANAIKQLSERHNLIIPGGAIGAQLPSQHAAGITFVFVDPEKETYFIPGKQERGVSKTALDRIAAAAGVRWNPHLCGRIDDGRDPYFVEYQAAGTVREMDGSERMICASKRVDLRADEDAPVSTWGVDAQKIAAEALAANPPKRPWTRVLQVRQFILELAESKAKNRAVRSLGVKTSYRPEDLNKGFAVVRLQYTAQSKDPEVQHEIELMIARNALSSTSLLYGEGERPRLAAPPTRVPRVQPIDIEPEDEPEEKPAPSTTVAPAPVQEQATKPVQPAGKAPAPAVPAGPARPTEDPMLICGKAVEGKWPRKLCSAFSVDQLRIKIEFTENGRSDWKPQWAEKNQHELDLMYQWLAFKTYDLRQGVLPGVNQNASEEAPF